MVLEILKARMNQGLPPHLYFWRDQTGHEIDLIGEWGGERHALEIKLGATFQRDYIKNLQYFMALYKTLPLETVNAYLIYTGSQTGSYLDVNLLPVNQLIDSLPWV